MPTIGPVVKVALDPVDADAARESLERMFQGKVEFVTDGDRPAGARLVSLDGLDAITAPKEPIVAIGDIELAELLPLMTRNPWLNHVVTPKTFDDKLWGTTLAGALWDVVTDSRRASLAPYLGKEFKGRQATVTDSDKRTTRVDTIAEYAQELGASSSLSERIRDVAEELLTNALYDAPAEDAGVRADRSARVKLKKEKACQLTYGVARQTFYLRVRDQYGALSRERLLTVLNRCAARADVEIDDSRGGAGLGMWRIFSAASLIVVRVKPHEFTDFIVGIDIQRGRRWMRGRAMHLFFSTPEGNDSQSIEVRS